MTIAEAICRKNTVTGKKGWNIPAVCYGICKKHHPETCTIYQSTINEQTRLSLEKANEVKIC